MDLLNEIGYFTWNFGNNFFIETSQGNFTWSDPDYPGGTNEIQKFYGTYRDWIKAENISYGRDKGTHKIRDYCGEAVKILLD